MDSIVLKGTQTTPKVVLDSVNNTFEISGESRPENTSKFYNPIISWLSNYSSVLYFQKNQFGKSHKMSLKFQLDYFNSTSAKFILDIFIQIEKMHKEGYEAEIVWNYDKRDEDMKESGLEFAKLVKSLPVKYVEF